MLYGGAAPKPNYIHDCSNCLFLGNTKIEDIEVDVYYHYNHNDAEDYGSVIMRFGDEASEYSSGPSAMFLYSDIDEGFQNLGKKTVGKLVQCGIISLGRNDKELNEKKELWNDYFYYRKEVK